MNVKNTSKQSQTDWKGLEAMSDAEIDVSDIPPLTDAFFERARVFKPQSQDLIALDADILAWFKSQSQDYQKRINKVLRQYMQAQHS